MISEPKPKYIVFSDEAGSWHVTSDDNLYLRSWVVITESSYSSLQNAMSEIAGFLDCEELKWKTISGHEGSKFLDRFNEIDFRIFITLTDPKDIDWDNKYNLTRNFEQNIGKFHFGSMSKEVVDAVKKKIFDDLKYVIFLNYYERAHIENASKRIEQVIKPDDYELEYKIDPPQSNKRDWEGILSKITDKNLEFPRSEKEFGIQFADIIAGAFKSLIKKDKNYDAAKTLFINNKSKIISRDKALPNPNIIFWPESNNEIKKAVAEIWSIR